MQFRGVASLLSSHIQSPRTTSFQDDVSSGGVDALVAGVEECMIYGNRCCYSENLRHMHARRERPVKALREREGER